MKFKALLLHQESVCATFGAGVSSACVVDVGGQCTSIGVVDDGFMDWSTGYQILLILDILHGFS